MKKMKKQNLKNLALLGLATGTVLSAQAVASEQTGAIDISQLLASGCNGVHGCHGSDQAYRSTPSQNNNYYYSNQSCNSQPGANGSGQPQNGCASNTPPVSSCSNTTPSKGQSPTAYNQHGSYTPSQQQWNTAQSTQPQTSCAGMSQPQQAQAAGCGGMRPSHGQAQTAYNQRGNYYYSQQPDASQSMQPQTMQPQTMQPQTMQPQPQQAQAAGCGGMRPSRGQAQTAYNPRGNYYYSQEQDGTQSAQPQTMQPQPTQPSIDDSGMNSSQGQSPTAYNQGKNDGFDPWQSTKPAAPQNSCASAPQQPSSGTQKQSASMQRSSRWETADNGKSASTPVAAPMSESDLMPQLNAQGKAAYQNLDASGKALALKMANQSCKGQNECKGLNSCKTTDHACAGKGQCAGTAEKPFKDKNLAVKVAGMKMAEKRAKASPSKF
ncbi:MAG: hypothetical protein WCF65_04815 [Parachlamydiaceae bacterium]